MKKIILSILTVGTVVLFSGCTDELENQFTKKNTGDEIVFGARASYEVNEERNNAPQTRTVYTGAFLNSKGTEWKTGDGAKYEGVHWIAGDQVRIYCPQAAGSKTADYTVTESDSGISTGYEVKSNHETSLVLNDNYAAGLQWGDTNSTHDFYAVYPAPSQYDNTTTADDVLKNTAEFVGEIPNQQSHIGYSKIENYAFANTDGGVPATGTLHVVKPNMKYAYMVAKKSVVPNNSTDEVYLSFNPIATAVEITVRNVAVDSDGKSYAFKLANMLVSSTDGSDIYGQFKAKLSLVDEYGTGDTAYEFVGAGGDQIQLPMYDGQDGIYGQPIILAYGDAIKFTVFLLPTVDLNSLKVTVNGVDGTKTGTITGIEIQKRKKTYLTNVPFAGKNVLPFTQEEWLKYVDDNAIVRELSIPGAGGAASSALTAGGTTSVTVNSTAVTFQNDQVRQQDLDIPALWNKGVRCFEFAVDIPSTDTQPKEDVIGSQVVVCNGVPCGTTTLSAAVNAVKNEIRKHPEEFAMVILTYQPLGGWAGNVARTPKAFMQQINLFWDGIKGGDWSVLDGATLPDDVELGTAKYDPSNATVGLSRGKLFCIARPTSLHQDYGTRFVAGKTGTSSRTGDDTETYDIGTPHADIMVIEGWGSLKDKWEQRGFSTYSLRGSTALVGTTYDNKYGRPFDVTTWHYCGAWNKAWKGTSVVLDDYKITHENFNPDFRYNISGSDSKAWVQEWARVSDLSESVKFPETDGCGYSDLLNFAGCDKEYVEIYWGNSYNEKLQRVQECLRYAVKKKIFVNGDNIDATGYTFINSLCGYYIDPTILDSYSPYTGTDGNISNGKSLTAESSTAGMCGNIADFAEDINKDFYNYLQEYTEGTGFVPGSMGIILMDRIGADDYSSAIPGIIVANNFQHKMDVAPTNFSLRKSNLENGDQVAAPAQRGVKSTDEGVSIVWE